MSDVRKPPIGAVLRLHQQGVRGWCGWCGLAVADKTPGCGWLKWWHDACADEMAIIERPDAARRAVFSRDKGICCDCGEDWSEMFLLLPEYGGRGTYQLGPNGEVLRTASISYLEPSGRSSCSQFYKGAIPYSALKVVSLWQADHKIPLWKIRHLPDLQRLEYFKLANLITRCHRCHQFKTDEEAAERAKYKRLGSTPEPKPKSKWASKPMQSRNGFPPRGSRPMRRKP